MVTHASQKTTAAATRRNHTAPPSPLLSSIYLPARTFRRANVPLPFDVPSPETAAGRGVADTDMPQSFELGVADDDPGVDPPTSEIKRENQCESKMVRPRGRGAGRGCFCNACYRPECSNLQLRGGGIFLCFRW